MPNRTALPAPVSAGRFRSPAHQEPPPPSAPPGLRRWLTLAVVLTAAFLGTLDFFIINLALPSMQADLHASFAQVQLVIAGYGLAYAVCLITGGRLGDIFGRKRVFLIGVAGFTLASVLCGLAPSPELLIAARIFQGLSGALDVSASAVHYSDHLPAPRARPRLRRLRRRLRRRLLLRHRPRRIAGPGQRLRPRLAAHLPRQPAHRPADPAGRLAVRSRIARPRPAGSTSAASASSPSP